MAEFFDIVDDKGNPTGETVERTIAHRDGIMHRAIHVWFYSKKGILLQLRAKDKDSCPNMWDVTCGGHIKAGDEPLQTVQLEITEELGLTIDESQLDFVKLRHSSNSHGDFHNNEIDYVYLYKFQGDISDIVFTDGEAQAVRWFSLSELQKELQNDESEFSFVPHGSYWGDVIEAVSKKL